MDLEDGDRIDAFLQQVCETVSVVHCLRTVFSRSAVVCSSVEMSVVKSSVKVSVSGATC